MRCKGCGKCGTKNINRDINWRDYQMCGVCAAENYPDRFRAPRRRTEKKTRLGLCEKCNEVAYKLNYVKSKRRSIELFYCHFCAAVIHDGCEVLCLSARSQNKGGEPRT